MSVEISKVEDKKALINIGDMPLTASEIYFYVKDELVTRASPLKQKSLDLHNDMEALKPDWEQWGIEEVELASVLHDDIFEHIKIVSYQTKPTELDSISNKAYQLHKGIVAAIKDILGDIPADKDILARKIRAWRSRAEELIREEERRLAEDIVKQEEERKLQNAIALEEEATRLKAMGHEGLAEEVKQEAESVLTEQPTSMPQPIIERNIPKGGPSKRKYTKIQITNLMVLIKAVASGIVPIQALKADESFIRNQAERLKSSFSFPGVIWWEE